MSVDAKPGKAFWALAILFLLWNLMGCGMYLFDAFASDAQYAQSYGADMVPLRAAYPPWAMGGYAVGVWGGLAGALMLILRKKLAVTLFILSFAGALISNFWTMTAPEVKAAASGSYWIMPLVITGLGVLEIWYARKKAASGDLS